MTLGLIATCPSYTATYRHQVRGVVRQRPVGIDHADCSAANIEGRLKITGKRTRAVIGIQINDRHVKGVDLVRGRCGACGVADQVNDVVSTGDVQAERAVAGDRVDREAHR